MPICQSNGFGTDLISNVIGDRYNVYGGVHPSREQYEPTNLAGGLRSNVSVLPDQRIETCLLTTGIGWRISNQCSVLRGACPIREVVVATQEITMVGVGSGNCTLQRSIRIGTASFIGRLLGMPNDRRSRKFDKDKQDDG